MVEIDVPLGPGEPPTSITVPANSPEEAFRFLYEVGNGTTAGLTHGSMLGSIRAKYKQQLEQIEVLIRQRRAALGPNPTEYELRGLAQWGARQRAGTARLWRLPLPVTALGLEVRDWAVYGAGGRTFDNVLARQAAKGLKGAAAYEALLGSATRSNLEINASIARGARFMRGGGAVLGTAGLALSAYDIWQAPAGKRLAVAQRHGVGFAGGLISAEVGVGLLTIGFGLLAATPPGWIILCVGLVAGIGGSMVADRMFYPEDYRPVAEQMRAGIAIDPQLPFRRLSVAPGTMASTVLPVIRQVVLVVQRSDTQATLSRRAYLQAAASVGLPSAMQASFADRHASSTGLSWIAGDPSPQNDRTVRVKDIAATAGKQVIFELSPTQRSELATAAAR